MRSFKIKKRKRKRKNWSHSGELDYSLQTTNKWFLRPLYPLFWEFPFVLFFLKKEKKEKRKENIMKW